MTVPPETETIPTSMAAMAAAKAQTEQARATDVLFDAEERRLWNPTPELLTALVEAMSEMGNAVKTGRNDHDRYDYGTLEDYLNAARGPLLKHGLVLVSRPVSEPQYGERMTGSGGKWATARVLVETRVIHGETQGWIASRVWGEGHDRGDKALYKALTGARKYGLAMVLGIYTTDEPEGDSPQTSGGRYEPNHQPTPPADYIPPPPTDLRWTEARQAKLLGKAAKIEGTEEENAYDKLDKAVSYVIAQRANGMTNEQFTDACRAIFGRGDELQGQGAITKEQGAELLARISSEIAPTTTADKLPTAEEPAPSAEPPAAAPAAAPEPTPAPAAATAAPTEETPAS